MKKNEKAITLIALIITILTLIILTVLAVFVINRTSIIEKIKQAIQKEKKPLFAYEIYDNQDESNIKVLVTVNSEDGIEYVVMPNETRIDCYNKTTKAIDYVAAKNSTSTFKVKEKGKDEKIETIKLDDQAVYNNGVALDETDQSGYREFTTANKLQSLKDKFTNYSYKIGENGEWIQANNVQNGTYKVSALDYDLMQKQLLNVDQTVNIYTKISDNIGNTVIAKQNYEVDTTENETTTNSESLLKAVEGYDKGNGKYTVTVQDETYNLKMYNIQGNLEISPDVVTTVGNETDVAQGTEESQMAKNMVVLKVNGNLTVDENALLTAYASKKDYGGPKGITIYCTGTIVNNGTISMTARGAYAEGQNVYMWKNTDESYEYVPKVGAEVEKDGTGRQTGGGGTGTSVGASGTSYSGGSGGGAGYRYQWTDDYGRQHWNFVPATEGKANGGAGGSRSGDGQGAGNPRFGTGGLLVIFGSNIENNKTIESNGSNGDSGAGGSGGGSINIFYKENYSNKNIIEANAGISRAGKGTVTITGPLKDLQ